MRLLVVSNRLPVTVERTRDTFNFKESVGGLVSGLSAYLDSLKGRLKEGEAVDYMWVGWPGTSVPEALEGTVQEQLLHNCRAWPVFLPEDLMDAFYHGFCNKTIWPLFHYFTHHVLLDEACWSAYLEVNRRFLKSVLEVYREGDIIWVQDYHLMLLPKLIRENLKEASIGFFLHIPFPSFETFRILPRKWSARILDGLLGADLIGFHTHSYSQYFLRCVLRVLGYEHQMGRFILGDHIASIKAFPMGIDFKKYHEASKSPLVAEEALRIKEAIGHYRVILSIDRLDYTKGIANRLQAFEFFLEKYPKWQKRVVLAIVVVPSRVAVDQYADMKRQIDELVGRINGKFGSIGWTPVIYQYRFLPFCPLVALYSACDVALVTPLRDGMNLIAKEYVASRSDGEGVLILSEMAGAYKELAEALIVNPNSKEEIVDAIHEALEMPKEEQRRRNAMMQDRLMRYDVVRWAKGFIEDIQSVKNLEKKFYSRLLSSQIREELLRKFSLAKNRLIFLDYDGTLVPFAPTPEQAKPSSELLHLLYRLGMDPKNDIVIISGRDKKTLQSWFGDLPVGLVAEHGVWVREKGGDFRLIKPLNNAWKSEIKDILEKFVDSLPGSHIEEKEFSLVWHYRRVTDIEGASVLVSEFRDTIRGFAANMDLQVLPGNKVVEIRNAGVDKGTAGLIWLSKKDYDFIMAMGDDWTDEDLFAIAPPEAFTIKVGLARAYGSRALYSIRGYQEAISLLESLVENQLENR